MRISDWSSDVCSSDLVNARLEAIDVEIGALVDRPISFDPADMAHAGAFMSIEVDGSLRIERGYVRPEDEPAADDTMEIGRASCRERVCQYVYISVVAGTFKKKIRIEISSHIQYID